MPPLTDSLVRRLGNSGAVRPCDVVRRCWWPSGPVWDPCRGGRQMGGTRMGAAGPGTFLTLEIAQDGGECPTKFACYALRSALPPYRRRW